MPFRRRSARRFGRRSSPPGRKVWGGWTTFDISGAIGPVNLTDDEFIHTWIMSPNDASDFYDEPTVIRLLFSFVAFALIPTSSISAEYQCNLKAAIMVNKSDENANVPFVNLKDSTKDYLWYKEVNFWHEAGQAFASPALSMGSNNIQGELDIRTRRKIPEGYGLSMQVWNDADVLFDPIALSFFTCGRFLMIDH